MGMRTVRFQARWTPELDALVERARGDVDKSRWVEGAIVMRLRAEGVLAGAPAARPVVGVADEVLSPPKARRRSRSDAEVVAESVVPAAVEAEPEDAVAEEAVPEPVREPVRDAYPRRPRPRMTGGRRKR